MDGIDAALVDCSSERPVLLATLASSYPPDTRLQLREALAITDPLAYDLSGLDNEIGRLFAEAARELLDKSGLQAKDIRAIGSHGQTIRHEPDAARPYSLQIGNPELICSLTGIDVIADFRNPDIRAGGQGAPLVPAFHHAVFASAQEPRVVLNIGGIANITIVPDQNPGRVTGFDTGPGNTLMDGWIYRTRQLPMDHDGEFAASGTVNEPLLQTMLRDPYFQRPPPKSTGLEYFNFAWLQNFGRPEKLSPEDVQATLCELTALTVADAIREYAIATRRLLVCGGGARNLHLMKRLGHHLPGIHVTTTGDFGLDPDWVEAAAFAWLASQRLAGKPGNLPAVTGAREAVLLGSHWHHNG